MKIILIAAIGKNREIGKNGNLIWKLKDDLYRFSVLTRDKVIIMGRKTFDSLPKSLDRREMVVLTKEQNKTHNNAKFFNSINEIIEYVKDKNEVYVIGGAEIYNQFLPLADELDLTLIDAEDKKADTFFPEFEDSFTLMNVYSSEQDNIKFKFTRWALKL